jgi:hypothetical protein
MTPATPKIASMIYRKHPEFTLSACMTMTLLVEEALHALIREGKEHVDSVLTPSCFDLEGLSGGAAATSSAEPDR